MLFPPVLFSACCQSHSERKQETAEKLLLETNIGDRAEVMSFEWKMATFT